MRENSGEPRCASSSQYRQTLIDRFAWPKANAQLALEKSQLLTGVRNDIEWVVLLVAGTCWRLMLFPSAYKSSAADALLAERDRIGGSHRMTDDIIEYVVTAPPLHAWLVLNRTQCSIRNPFRPGPPARLVRGDTNAYGWCTRYVYDGSYCL
jgi:hypothetical protein